MQTLNRTIVSSNQYPTKVIQFGEGNFLRAFVEMLNSQDGLHPQDGKRHLI